MIEDKTLCDFACLNVCVEQFIGIETGNLFPGLKRIAIDETANANVDLIDYAFRLGYIFDNEYKFLMETRRERNLSSKQVAWKTKINRRILNKTIVRKNLKKGGSAGPSNST